MITQDRYQDDDVFRASSWNKAADAVDELRVGVKVRRTAPMLARPAFTDRTVRWQAEDYDPYAMWDALADDIVTIRVDGLYLAIAQTRWSCPSTGSPYNTGQRTGKILLNSTDVTVTDLRYGVQDSTKVAWAVDGEGVTVKMRTALPCVAGDRFFVNYWHSASGSIDCLHTDFGGTYFSVHRLSALP